MTPATVLAMRPAIQLADQGGTDMLAKLELASALLQEVRNIQDAKGIHDVAKAAGVYAREHKLGREVFQKARAVVFEALRRLGELLHESERALPGPVPEIPSDYEGISRERPPTLAQLGIDYKTSSIAQRLFALPQHLFERVRDGHSSLDDVWAEAKRADKRASTVDRFSHEFDVEAADLRVCSCADLFATGIRPSAVITEPPSGRRHIGVFSELARACVDVPLVAVRVDLRYLLEATDGLRALLTYRGGSIRNMSVGNVPMYSSKVTLMFGHEDAVARARERERSIPDTTEQRSCAWHAYLVQRFAGPGEIICDPFLRPEIAIATLEFGRQFVGCSLAASVVADTRQRLEARAR